MISKILVPIDGSENSLRALNSWIILKFKIKIKINYFICNRSTAICLYSITKTYQFCNDSLEKEAKDILDIGKNQAKKYDIEPETIFLEGGNIGSIIIDYSEKNNFDFIVIGSRGNGKFKPALLGSVSHRVLHHSKNPVLIVK